MKVIKGKKKQTKRKQAREKDEFDDMLDQYKFKFLKRFNQALEKDKKNTEDGNQGPAFEE